MSKTIRSRSTKRAAKVRQTPDVSHVGEQAGHRYVSLLGLQVFETDRLLKKIQEGLAYSTWDNFLQNTGFSREVVAGAVGIPVRTLSRRKDEGRLHPDESDRLVRLARLFAQALELFGGTTRAARHWLTTPQPALGGATPLDYSSAEVGAREVENLIGRLEHGVPS